MAYQSTCSDLWRGPRRPWHWWRCRMAWTSGRAQHHRTLVASGRWTSYNLQVLFRKNWIIRLNCCLVTNHLINVCFFNLIPFFIMYLFSRIIKSGNLHKHVTLIINTFNMVIQLTIDCSAMGKLLLCYLISSNIKDCVFQFQHSRIS